MTLSLSNNFEKTFCNNFTITKRIGRMKRLLTLLLLISIILMLRYTKVGCNVTSFIIVKLVQLVHLLLILFIVLGPFVIKEKEVLLFYVVVVSFIIFHWILSSDVCALTLLEQWVTGNPSEFTFVGRLVKPVYNITNRHVMCLTVILLLIAFTRAVRMYKLL
ncbi:MAG: hypothetical protein PHG66_00755 [Candidatus Colwellbacteria bacterium]|nr:hypothetical protein [Candidatus Colwellbacteria bacterium]